MKVRTTAVQEVELDNDAVEQVFNARLDRMCGGEHLYIDSKTGKVMSWEDTGHGSGLTEEVEDPSPRMVAALKFRAALQELKREESRKQEEARQKMLRESPYLFDPNVPTRMVPNPNFKPRRKTRTAAR